MPRSVGSRARASHSAHYSSEPPMKEGVVGVNIVLSERAASSIVACCWLSAFVVSLFITSSFKIGGLEEFSAPRPLPKKAAILTLPPAPAHPREQQLIQTKPLSASAAAANAPSASFLDEVDDLHLSALALLTRIHPRGGQGTWHAVFNSTKTPPERRVEVFKETVAIVDRIIAEKRMEVWDNSSCDDNYEKECPDWVTRDPSECVVRDSMLAACRRSCGYCGPLALFASELEKGDNLRRRLGGSKPERFVIDETKEDQAAQEKKQQEVAGDDKAILEFIKKATSRRVPVDPAIADEYIRKAIDSHPDRYPGITSPGPDPANVAEKAAPGTNTPKRSCDEVSKASREQTKAARSISACVQVCICVCMCVYMRMCI
jgi:hypothetical protein